MQAGTQAGTGTNADTTASTGSQSGGTTDTSQTGSSQDTASAGTSGGQSSSGGEQDAAGDGSAQSDGGDAAGTGDTTGGGEQDAAMADSADGSMRTLLPDPAWDCGMPEGLPVPDAGTLAFEIVAQLGDIHDVGQTPLGHRELLEIRGGTMQGPEIDATLLDGGLDWQLTLDNGVVEVEQALLIQTNDRASIYLRNCGLAAGSDMPVRIVPDFEAPNASNYSWLNDGSLVGTREVDRQAGTMTMRVYDVSSIDAAAGDALQIEKPAGVPSQSWDCQPASGRQGAVAFTEHVNIGTSVSVGVSKNGNRNVIPITGGTTSGKVQGSVLSGGADFQLLDNLVLDARYTLLTDDSELILVRNCGPASSLVPRFETRSDGPYAWVNEDAFLSSSPGIAVGAVNITVYDRN